MSVGRRIQDVLGWLLILTPGVLLWLATGERSLFLQYTYGLWPLVLAIQTTGWVLLWDYFGDAPR